MEQLLILTGTMGVGKTAVLAEASDILTLRDIVHAAIDLDFLGLGHFQLATTGDGVLYDNLRSVCKNYAAVGVPRVLLARALENGGQLKLCRQVTAAARTVVCRLTASVRVMQERLRMRELGVLQEKYVARVAELNSILDHAGLEDFTVSNEDRSLTDVALEVLVKAAWISSKPRTPC
jgi:adenylylsulfate kinase